MKKLIKKFLKLFYPDKCIFCGVICEEGICEFCQKQVTVIEEPYCMKCGKPIKNPREEFCYDCSRIQHSYDCGRSLWIHKSPVNEAIYAFKYHNKRVYAEVFARNLAKKHGQFLRDNHIEAIIPIPLHKSRRRKRGYNQTELVAEHLSRYTGIPVEKDLLLRVKKTNPQKRLNDKQRKKNMKHAFVLKKESSLKKVVLLDDIYTTGSTMDEAASILRATGIKKVYYLTISIGQGY